MKRKGFTLVELLAVIAILAILVIIALPNVLKMYGEARVSSFENEVKNTYSTTRNQFLLDSMSSTNGSMTAYTNTASSIEGVDTVKPLEMTSSSNFKYYVLVNSEGQILNIRITNGTYSYAKKAENASNEIKIEDINVTKDNDVDLESNITDELCPVSEDTYGGNSSSVTPNYIYSIADGSIGDTAIVNNVWIFDNFDDASAAFYDSDVVAAYVVDENNKITQLYVAFKTNGTVYYLKGGDPDAYNKNYDTLNRAFPGACSKTHENEDEEYRCTGSDHSGYADTGGMVNATDNESRLFCYVNNRYSECE